MTREYGSLPASAFSAATLVRGGAPDYLTTVSLTENLLSTINVTVMWTNIAVL
jgi:hypothetical protein